MLSNKAAGKDAYLDLLPSATSLDPGLGGQRVHQGLDGVTSVPLLDETDSRVDQQQEDDTDEILPIRRSALTVGKGDGDQSGTLHDPGQGVPHEGQELEEGVLLLGLKLQTNRGKIVSIVFWKASGLLTRSARSRPPVARGTPHQAGIRPIRPRPQETMSTYLVGTEDSDTPDGLFLGKTLVVTLQQDKDVLHRDVLDVDLVLVVEV